MSFQAPDLGVPFHPSPDKLRNLSQDLTKIILNFLKEKKFLLLFPTPKKLPAYLVQRMREQGRFAGLVVTRHQAPGTRHQFLKFPLGGETAKTAACRQAKILRFLTTLNFPPLSRKLQPLIPNTQITTLRTPLGWALLSNYYKGLTLDKWLRQAPKSQQEKMAQRVIEEICRWQRFLNSKQASTKVSLPSFLFKKSAIHTFNDYFREVNRRLKEHPEFPQRFKKKVLGYINLHKKIIKKYQGKFVFAHRDFFAKNIIVQADEKLAVIDFEHAAIIKNYLLGLNFDLANIIVQSYQYPAFQKALLVPKTGYPVSGVSYLSLNLCLIIQALAKIAPTAQKMTPGGYGQTYQLLKKTAENLKSK